jgi:flagellar hook assembly protein FlgD
MKEAGQMVPTEFSLSQNFPNPFNPSTSVRVALPQRSTVNLAIFNLLGQRTRTLFTGELESGIHWFTWDGKNEQFVGAQSGVYYCRLVIEGRQHIVRKLVLVK